LDLLGFDFEGEEKGRQGEGLLVHPTNPRTKVTWERERKRGVGARAGATFSEAPSLGAIPGALFI